MEVFLFPTLWRGPPLISVNLLGSIAYPSLGRGFCAWTLLVRQRLLGALAGASLRQALGLPQREGPALRLASSILHLAKSAGAGLARCWSAQGVATNHGGMDASHQTEEYTTQMDGRPRNSGTPRGDGVPGIKGQRQREGTGQNQGSLPGSAPESPSHPIFLRGPRTAETQPQTQRREGHSDFDRNQVSEMSSVQLDYPGGLQILRNTLGQAIGYFQQLYSAVGQAFRHHARQNVCGCRRRLRPSQPVGTELGKRASPNARRTWRRSSTPS